LDIHEIAIPSALSMDIDKYKVNAIQKKAIEYSNKNLETKFGAGDKPKRLYISKSLDPKYPWTDVLALDWYMILPPELVVDYPRMLDTVKSKIAKLIDVVGISWNDLTLDGNLSLTQMKISLDSERYKVLSRDSFTCRKCNIPKQPNELIVTVKEKGLDRDNLDNLIVMCKECKKETRKEVKNECSVHTLDSFLKKEE
jgi:hypothetical protein